MNHFATPDFWRHYRRLPIEVQELADKNFALLKANPQHPSLHFKKIRAYWSARVGITFAPLRKSERRAWCGIGSAPIENMTTS
jgi:hypothetical protein